MKKTEIRGRQLTKRLVTLHENGGETSELKAPRVSLRQLSALKKEALEVIRAAGIELEIYLDKSPHGSMLRDAVINLHQHPDDSITGLAARIYEHAAHVQSYREVAAFDQALDLMAELGRLVTIFDAYQKASTDASKAGKKGSAGKTSKSDQIKQLAAKYIQDGREQRFMAGTIAVKIGVTPHYVRQVLKEA